MTPAEWLPMAGPDRLARATRWEQCCWDRYQNARAAYRTARTELEEAGSAYDAANRELSRIRHASQEASCPPSP